MNPKSSLLLRVYNLDAAYKIIGVDCDPSNLHCSQAKYLDYAAKKHRRGNTYEVKFLKSEEREKTSAQLQKYAQIQSKHSAKLIAFNITEGAFSKITLITKWRPHTLKEALTTNKQLLKEGSILQHMQTLAHSLYELHRKGLPHNNILLSNIFFNKEQMEMGLPYFGSIEKIQRRLQQTFNFQKNYFSIYNAPEFFQGHCHSSVSDVWSLGVVFLQMILGQVLQDKNSIETWLKDLNQQIQKVESKSFKQLLQQMLVQNVENRLTSEEVLNYLLMKNIERKDKERNKEKTIQFSLCQLLPLKSVILDSTNLNENTNLQQLPQFKTNKYNIYGLKTVKSNRLHSLLIVFNMNFHQIQYKLSVTLTCKMIQQSLKGYASTLQHFLTLLKESKQQLHLSDDGSLNVNLPSNNGQLKKRPQLQIEGITKLHRIGRCMVKIRNEVNEEFEGLLVGDRFVLTLGRTVCSYQRKYEIINQVEAIILRDNGGRQRLFSCNQFNFPNQLLQCYNEHFDYSLIMLPQPIRRNRYISIAFEYSERETLKKLQKLGENVRFHYQLGSHIALGVDCIDFESEKGKFNILCELDIKCRPGCPLLVVFSNNHCYSIGIFTKDNSGYLHDENMRFKLSKWIIQFKQLITENKFYMTTRIERWKTVSLQYPEPPYLIGGLSSEKETDYLPTNMNLSPQELKQIEQLPSTMMQLSIDINKEKVPLYLQFIEQSQKYYGPQNQLAAMSYAYLSQQLQSHQPQMVPQDLIAYAKKALKLQQVRQQNISIVYSALITLSKIGVKQRSIPGSRELLDYLDRHRATIEKMDYYPFTVDIYKGFSLHHMNIGNHQISQFFQNKIVELCLKEGNCGLALTTVFYFNKVYIILGNVKKLIRSMEVVFRLISRGKKYQNEYGSYAEKDWQSVSTLLLESENVSVADIDQFIRLTVTYIPDKEAVISIFQEKRKRVALKY